MLRTTYLRPLRDAKSELSSKRNSRLSQILFSHKAFEDKTGHRFIELAKKLNIEIANYFKGEDADGKPLTSTNDLLGRGVKEVIDTYLKQFNKKSTEFEMTPANLKGILESLSLLFQDGHNLGLGSHNLLCIASELLHLKKDNWDGLRLGLIEEIEAHLHPQVQLQVVETLKMHSADMQLIFTTHSPNIGSKISLENMIICHKGQVFPLTKGSTKLANDDYQFLEIFLDTTKANLFFAKGVILVEGWAEELLIPGLAKSIGIDLTAHGVAIINVGSTAYLRYSKIFQRKAAPLMEIPVSIVTDVDVRDYEKKQKLDALGKPELNGEGKNIYLYIKKAPAQVATDTAKKKTDIDDSEANVQYYIGERWTLEYALHHSTSMNALFKSTAEGVHSKTDWTNFEAKLAEKLIEKSLDKTEIAYRLATQLNVALKTDPDRTKSPLKEINNTDLNTDSIGYLLKAIKHAAGY